MSAKKTNKTKVDVNEEVCEGVCYHTAAVQLISYGCHVFSPVKGRLFGRACSVHLRRQIRTCR